MVWYDARMSKAFTKESDAPEVEDDLEDAAPPIPAGAKNYITPAGLRRLQDELRQLKTVERPKVVEIVSWAAGNGDRSENGDYLYGKKRLREIDRRIRFLLKRLEIAEPVDPKLQKNREQVFFGASVTYVDHHGAEKSVRIVGIDEARIEQGEISWISPVARALMKAREGDIVDLRTPHGLEQIEVVTIAYRDEDAAP
jgi:transcription elongation factor GreB